MPRPEESDDAEELAASEPPDVAAAEGEPDAEESAPVDLSGPCLDPAGMSSTRAWYGRMKP